MNNREMCQLGRVLNLLQVFLTSIHFLYRLYNFCLQVIDDVYRLVKQKKVKRAYEFSISDDLNPIHNYVFHLVCLNKYHSVCSVYGK